MTEMISQVFDIDCFKIMSLFSVSPGSSFRRNEIKEKTMINNVPLDKALLRLVSSSIVKKEKNIYRINFESEEALKIIEIAKRQHKMLREVPLGVYFLVLDMARLISSQKGVETYLFGSYSKMVYKENSDIDIAIIHPAEFSRKEIEKASLKLEKSYSKKVDMHYFDKKAFYSNKKDPLVAEILRNGIRIA